MGTLYVVGLPAGDPDDLTLRARRVLEATPRWVAVDPGRCRSRLAGSGIAEPAAGIATELEALTDLAMGDAALLVDGARLALEDDARRLVAAALAHGFPVVPVPGPALPLTALVISGLPADSFCYAGELGERLDARRSRIEAVARQRRTLLFLVRGAEMALALAELAATLGPRPLVVVAGDSSAQEPPWRGTLEAACQEGAGLPAGDVRVLVVGGAPEEPAAWDEARLAAAIERRIARGEGAKEISQALADLSGWSRREIYRRATKRTGTR